MDGFPHSGILRSQLVCSSPRLIAAYRALHRLSMPRHPPCALLRLISLLVVLGVDSISPDPRRDKSHRESAHHPTFGCQRAEAIDREKATGKYGRHQKPFATPRRSVRPTRHSRKEVIQPQVPLRLPCYDFAPVIELTFGGCPSCELAHRLQVPPASMA